MKKGIKVEFQQRKEFGEGASQSSVIANFKVVAPIIDTVFRKLDADQIVKESRLLLNDYIEDIICYKQEVHINCYYGEGIPVENIEQLYYVLNLIDKEIKSKLSGSKIFDYEIIVHVSTLS